MTTNPLDLDAGLAAHTTWHVDPWHTAVHFATRNRGAGRIRGRFLHTRGTVITGAELTDASVEITLDASSLTTGVAARDGHLRSAAFLDAEQFPTATFVSREVVREGLETFTVVGDLTFKGRSQEMRLTGRWEGAADDPFVDGSTHLAFSGTGTLRLSHLGLGQPLGRFNIPGLGDAVELTLDLVLISYDPAPMLASIPVD